MNFNQIFDLMVQAFPIEEYRTYDDQKKLLKNKNYHIYTQLDKNKNLIGFMAFWTLDSFVYLEHFAVDQKYRGHGIGSTMLKNFLKNQNKDIILEVELAETLIQEKRIKFYERHGFKLNTYEYLQPPLRKGCTYYPLQLMSYNKTLNLNDFTKIKNTLYQKVYKISL